MHFYLKSRPSLFMGLRAAPWAEQDPCHPITILTSQGSLVLKRDLKRMNRTMDSLLTSP